MLSDISVAQMPVWFSFVFGTFAGGLGIAYFFCRGGILARGRKARNEGGSSLECMMRRDEVGGGEGRT